jgi:hypothetical protein
MRSSAPGGKRKTAAKGIWISNLQRLWCKSRVTREMPGQEICLSAAKDRRYRGVPFLDREIALALHYPVEQRPFRRPVPLATLAGGTFLSNLAGCCPSRWHGFAPSRCAAEIEEVSKEGLSLPGTVQR